MGFVRNRLLKFGPLGRVADVALVSGTALRFARRKGWVSSETANKFGAPDSSGGSAVSVAELALALAAATRLFGRAKNRKSD